MYLEKWLCLGEIHEVATRISSAARYDHFDTSPNKNIISKWVDAVKSVQERWCLVREKVDDGQAACYTRFNIIKKKGGNTCIHGGTMRKAQLSAPVADIFAGIWTKRRRVRCNIEETGEDGGTDGRPPLGGRWPWWW